MISIEIAENVEIIRSFEDGLSEQGLRANLDTLQEVRELT